MITFCGVDIAGEAGEGIEVLEVIEGKRMKLRIRSVTSSSFLDEVTLVLTAGGGAASSPFSPTLEDSGSGVAGQRAEGKDAPREVSPDGSGGGGGGGVESRKRGRGSEHDKGAAHEAAVSDSDHDDFDDLDDDNNDSELGSPMAAERGDDDAGGRST